MTHPNNAAAKQLRSACNVSAVVIVSLDKPGEPIGIVSDGRTPEDVDAARAIGEQIRRLIERNAAE